MRVGTKGRYAAVALIDIIRHSHKGPVALGEVAQRQRISLSYLEQLFAMLRRAGLVVASRGPGGGYRVHRPAEDIALAEVFRAVEDVANPGESGRDWADGPGSHVWASLDQHIAAFLEKVSLADAARFEERIRPAERAIERPAALSASLNLA